MTVSLKHNFTSAIADDGDATKVQPSNWNEEHVLTQATGKLLGRTTAGTGATEEIGVSADFTLSGGTLSLSFTAPSLSGNNTWTGQNTFAAGSITTSQPFTVSQTWNAGAVTFVGRSLAITDTASAAASLADKVTVGGSTIYSLGKTGNGTFAGYVQAGAGSSSAPSINLSGDTATGWYRPASNEWAFTLSSTPRIRMYGASGLMVAWGSNCRIGFANNANPVAGSVDISIGRKAAGVIEFNSGSLGTYAGTAYGSGAQTVAQLPAAATAGAGARSFVTDATATTFLSTVAGGGANKVPVVSDGANWLIG